MVRGRRLQVRAPRQREKAYWLATDRGIWVVSCKCTRLLIFGRRLRTLSSYARCTPPFQGVRTLDFTKELRHKFIGPTRNSGGAERPLTYPIETLEVIELFYRAALEPELWPEALHKLALCTGGFGTAMIPITPMKTDGLIVSEGLQEPNIEYEREWWRYDTRVSRIFSRKITDGVCCEAELFTEEELARDPMRQEFCPQYNIGAFAAQLVKPLPNFVVAFSVQRAGDLGHFDRRHLDTLALLGKHAARALLISTHLAAARQAERSVSSALAQLNCGALIVDHDMKVVVANDAAQRMLDDGLCITQGQLRAGSPGHRQPFARLIRSALNSDPGANNLETIALPRPTGRKPLLVQAIPISPGLVAGEPAGQRRGPRARCRSRAQQSGQPGQCASSPRAYALGSAAGCFARHRLFPRRRRRQPWHIAIDRKRHHQADLFEA